MNDSAINRILAILETVYKGFDEYSDSLFISLDISKAFDRVWHEGLIYKLKQNGIEGKLLKWFSSYLGNRKQKVVIGGSSSTFKPVQAGVPQGSILGPLLFLIYVNDMTNDLEANIHQFADDTNLLYTYKNFDQVAIIANRDLKKLSEWANTWRVSFNALKTHFIIFSLKRNRNPINTPITFNDVQINEVNKLVSLGVTLTNNLSWYDHILSLINKSTKRMFILKSYRNILPRRALIQLYKTMILPILEYGDILYNNTTHQTSQILENIQRQAAILCTGAYRHTSYNSLLNDLSWESLTNRRRFHQLILFYKIYYRIYPKYLYDHLNFTNENDYNLRNPTVIQPRRTRTQVSSNSFFPLITREWNRLPTQTQNALSVSSFKALLIGNNKQNIYHNLCTGKTGILITRIRLGLSALNSQRFKYNLIQQPTCNLCNTVSETPYHYFFNCPSHNLARITLLEKLTTEVGIDTQNKEKLLETILQGKHIHPRDYERVLTIVRNYISSSNRFL